MTSDDADPRDLWIVIGLGNPGPEYSGNRHNVGFMVADLLAGRMGGKLKAHKARADVLEGRLAGTRIDWRGINRAADARAGISR